MFEGYQTLTQINDGSCEGKETIKFVVVSTWCDYRRRVRGPDVLLRGRVHPTCPHFQCQIPKCAHFILRIVSGKTLSLVDTPLKRGSFCVEKEQLITVMVTMYSFVLHISKDAEKHFKSSSEVDRK